MLTHFSDERMAKWQSFGYSEQIKCLIPAYSHLFSDLHYAVLFLTNVIVNATLTQFYGFCKLLLTKHALLTIGSINSGQAPTNLTRRL